MGRPHRILVDAGVYHIISRGHNRYRLFNSMCDYLALRKIIKDYKERFLFDIFHYCLMPNHTHLLLKISKGSELPYLMQGINQSYAKHYKRLYGLVGNIIDKGLKI